MEWLFLLFVLWLIGSAVKKALSIAGGAAGKTVGGSVGRSAAEAFLSAIFRRR